MEIDTKGSENKSKNKNDETYDAHSHIGTDTFIEREGNVSTYLKTAEKLHVTTSNIMPVPCPTYKTSKGTTQALIWEGVPSGFRYFRKTLSESGTVVEENPVNPYAEANNNLRQVIDKKNSGINLRYVPLIHPLLDAQEQVEKILSQRPIAVKIHGIAAGITPKQVPEGLLRVIASSRIPVIVHTDNFSKKPKTSFDYLRRENRAIKWIDIFEKTGVRGYISHGAYLCPESFERINNTDQFLLGIGPVRLLQEDKEFFLQESPQDESTIYPRKIFEQVEIGKVAFDIDFPCNTYDVDFTMPEAISRELAIAELSESEKGKVLSKNSIDFFG
jgi:hypothetical protein